MLLDIPKSTFFGIVNNSLEQHLGFFIPRELDVITTDQFTITRFVFILIYSDSYQEVVSFDVARSLFLDHDLDWMWSLIGETLVEKLKRLPKPPIGDNVVLSEN